MAAEAEALSPAQQRYARFTWATLIYTLGVVVWGAYVRASGSGAGCGSHWPDCNGVVIPRSPSVQTMIEFTHRVTSGLCGLLVLAVLIGAFRLYPKAHVVRRFATWSMVLTLTEALIGAAIVKLGYVADDPRVMRALWMSVHLINTFLLVAAITLTAHHAQGARAVRWRGQGAFSIMAGVAIAATLLVGVSGAIAALGDTLYPADSLRDAIAQDLSPTAHVLVRLRIAHPFIAIGTAFLLLSLRQVARSRRDDYPGVARWGLMLRIVVLSQLGLGLVNVMLLAPIPLQLVHLLLADVLWIVLLLFLAHMLAEPEPAKEARTANAAPISSRAPAPAE